MAGISIKKFAVRFLLFIIFLLILTEITLQIGGFIFSLSREYKNKISLRGKKDYVILCLGESTTAGQGNNSYPLQLEEILNERHTGINFKVINGGLAGANTSTILAKLEDNLIKYKPDMVITMMGVDPQFTSLTSDKASSPKMVPLLRLSKTYKLINFLRQDRINKKAQRKYRKEQNGIPNGQLNRPLFNDEELDELLFNLKQEHLQKITTKNTGMVPESGDIYIEISHYHINKGNYNQAKKLLNEAIKKNLELDRACVALGNIYALQGQTNQAEDSFKKAIRANPKNPLAYYHLGNIYEFQKRYAEAEEILRRALDIKPEDCKLHRALGLIHMKQKKYDEAKTVFKKLLDINPADLGGYFLLALCYKETGETDETEKILKKMEQINPEDPGLKNLLIMARQEKEPSDKTGNVREEDYYHQIADLTEKSPKTAPADADLYIKMARYYKNTGNYNKAQKILKEAIKTNFELDKIYIESGDIYRFQKQIDQAEDSFKKAIRVNPRNILAYYHLGNIHKIQKRYAEGEKILKEAIDINPDYFEIHAELGEIYMKQEKYDKAKTAFKKSIDINPTVFRTYSLLTLCYKKTGEYEEIEEILKKAEKANPENIRFKNLLVLFYQDREKYESAEEYAAKAEELRAKLSYYNPIARRNYQELKRILIQKGVKQICVQYPVQKLEPLKEMLSPRGNIIFVDNEKIFKEAVKKEGYYEYFNDMFGGDFGHCTIKGNKLLATNIANVILNKCFNK